MRANAMINIAKKNGWKVHSCVVKKGSVERNIEKVAFEIADNRKAHNQQIKRIYEGKARHNALINIAKKNGWEVKTITVKPSE